MNLRLTVLAFIIGIIVLGYLTAPESDRESIRLTPADQVSPMNFQAINLVIDVPVMKKLLFEILAKPTTAYLLFGVGVVLICLELRNAGAVVPGALGTLATMLALHGFHMLRLNLLGLALLLLALLLFAFGARLRGIAFLSLGGIIAAVLGSLILVNVDAPELAPPPGIVLGVAIAISLILIILFRLGVKSRRAKLAIHEQEIIGMIGRAETDFEPEGFVFVRGELWRAHAQIWISKGSSVQVAGLHGPVLEVEAC